MARARETEREIEIDREIDEEIETDQEKEIEIAIEIEIEIAIERCGCIKLAWPEPRALGAELRRLQKGSLPGR